MTCLKCNATGFLNSAGGKDFYFCPTCREEILPEIVHTPPDGDYKPILKGPVSFDGVDEVSPEDIAKWFGDLGYDYYDLPQD